MVQVEIVPEVPTHVPEAVSGAVVEVAFLGRPLGIEVAPHQVRKINVGRIGRARVSAADEADPEIKVGREGGLVDVDARDFVQKDAAVDDLLAPRVTTRAEVYQGAGGELGAGRGGHGHQLDRSRLEERAVEAAKPGHLLPAALR